MNNKIRFVRALLLTFISLVAITGVINYVVDPYDTYQTFDIEGINSSKPAIYTNNSAAKAQLIKRIKPVSLVLGNSRSEVGINPQSKYWSNAGYPRFNFSQASTEMQDVLSFLKYANSVQKVSHLLITTDFLMFKAERITSKRKKRRRKNMIEHFYSDSPVSVGKFRSLFSLDALKASLYTLGIQKGDKDYRYMRNGMRSYRILEKEQMRNGHNRMFDKSEDYFVQNKFYKKPDNGLYLKASKNGVSPGLEALKEIIDIGIRNDIQITFIISPVHVRMLEMIAKNKNWQEFENWKRAVTRIIHEANQNRPAEKHYVLWDFSGYNTITTEAVPKHGDTATKMKWYWEASHYKEETGDLMLMKIFGHKLPSTVPDDFGVKLTNNNIERHIDKINTARKLQER